MADETKKKKKDEQDDLGGGSTFESGDTDPTAPEPGAQYVSYDSKTGTSTPVADPTKPKPAGQPGLIDSLLSYPKAALGGYAMGYNTDRGALMPEAPHLDDSFAADMAKHPNVAGAHAFLGRTFNEIPGSSLTRAQSPDLAAGEDFNPLNPESTFNRTVSNGPSADSKLGAAEGKDGGVIVPPQSNEYGVDKALLDRLTSNSSVPMLSMRTADSDKGYDDQIAAQGEIADAEKKANAEATPLYADQAEYQKGLREKYGAQGDQSIADQRNFMQKAAEATERYENYKTVDPDGTVHEGLDPEHYWHSMETPKKIWTMASMIIGGGGSGITHGPNQAAQRIQAEIERDTQAQIANRNAHKEAADTYKGLAGVAHQTFGDIHQQATFLNGMKLGETASLLNHIAGKYNDPIISARAKAAAGALLAAKDKAFNEAAAAENKSRVESAHAGAMMRQANGQILQQLLEGQKLKQNENTLTVPGYGKAHSPQEAEEVRKGIADNAAAQAQLTKAKTASADTSWYSMPSTVTANRAAIEGVLAHLPKEQADQLRSELGSGRFNDQKQALEQIEALLKTNAKANVGRLDQGARGNNVQYTQ